MFHERLRDGIHERYPSMRKELKEGGMASFLGDMSIEVNLLDKPDNQHGLLGRRKRHAASDASEHLETVDALEKAV